jgi:hypothetical protein
MSDDDHARVRCYAEDKPRLNDLKQGDDTQADVIRRLLDGAGQDGTDAPVAEVSPEVSLDVDTVADALEAAHGGVEAGLDPEVREQLDRIEASAATVEERTGQIQRDVEDLGR